jgi:hypothetical protein
MSGLLVFGIVSLDNLSPWHGLRSLSRANVANTQILPLWSRISAYPRTGPPSEGASTRERQEQEPASGIEPETS